MITTTSIVITTIGFMSMIHTTSVIGTVATTIAGVIGFGLRLRVKGVGLRA